MPSCVSSLVQNLKNELISPKFGSDCYKQAILTELLVHMNRIMLNKNELSIADNSITSICYQCGFKSYSSFYRAYTLKYNVAPKRAKNINS